MDHTDSSSIGGTRDDVVLQFNVFIKDSVIHGDFAVKAVRDLLPVGERIGGRHNLAGCITNKGPGAIINPCPVLFRWLVLAGRSSAAPTEKYANSIWEYFALSFRP